MSAYVEIVFSMRKTEHDALSKRHKYPAICANCGAVGGFLSRCSFCGSSDVHGLAGAIKHGLIELVEG